MKHLKLKRSFGLAALIIYGLGDILGAGIYALIGKVAAEAGSFSWISFLISMIIAMLTALSYAELTSRHPRSGGASYFAQVAFGKKSYAFIVGWLLLCVSVVSMATLTNAFAGYIKGFGWGVSPMGAMTFFIGILTLINLWGIKQSSMANMISTGIEVFGLVVVAVAGVYFLVRADSPTSVVRPSISMINIVQGAALAFYAFIGFEDLANIAEEVKNPKRHLPIAVVASLVIAGIFYVFIGWISTAVLSPSILAKSPNPMTDIVEGSGLTFPLSLFGVIALFAVANTCLLNFITGSRLLYGMAEQGLVPGIFEKIHRNFRTPIISIMTIAPLALLLAATGNLKFLAGTTSVLILLVFCSTNLSLIQIKKKEPRGEGFQIPPFVPWLGLATNIGLIIAAERAALLAGGGFFLAGIGLYWILHKWLEKRNSSSKKSLPLFN